MRICFDWLYTKRLVEKNSCIKIEPRVMEVISIFKDKGYDECEILPKYLIFLKEDNDYMVVIKIEEFINIESLVEHSKYLDELREKY